VTIAGCTVEPFFTMSFPKGVRASGISLKFATPSGIPITVMHSNTPANACSIASHRPDRTNQTTLPTRLGDCEPPSRLTTDRPKGQSAKPASLRFSFVAFGLLQF
jgi:hypothetical protein